MDKARMINRTIAYHQEMTPRIVLRKRFYVMNETVSLIILAIASALAAGLLLLPVTLPGVPLI